MDGAVSGIVVHIQVVDIEQGLICVVSRVGDIGLYDGHATTTFSDVASRFALGAGTARRRGLAISSMPKFRNASPAPSRAMHRPGGTNHHHDPSSSASLLPAQ